MHKSFQGLSRVRPAAIRRANQYSACPENSILSRSITTFQNTGSHKAINTPTLVRSTQLHSHHHHHTSYHFNFVFRRLLRTATTTEISKSLENLSLDQPETMPDSVLAGVSPKFYDPAIIPPEPIKEFRELYGEVRHSKDPNDRERVLFMYRSIADDIDLLLQLQPIDFMFAMNSCRDLRRTIPRMQQILQDVGKSAHSKVPEIYNIMLKGYTKLSDFKSCTNMIDKMKAMGIEINTATYHIILDICKHERKAKDAKGVLEKMRKNNVEVTSATYLILLSICARCKATRQAQEYFDEMPLLGLEQDTAHYNALINVYSHAKDLAGAQRILELMEDEGIQPDMYTYAALIRGWKSVKKPNEINKLMKELENRGQKPNVKVLVTIGIDPVTVVEECLNDNIDITPQDFNLLISRSLKSNQFLHVPLLLEYMQKAGHSPTVHTYTAMIDANLKMGKYPEAKEVFKAISKANVQADVIAYSAIISGALTYAGVEESMEILKSMIGDGLLPNLHTFNSLLSASIGEIGIEGFKTIRYTMQQLHIRPDQRSFNSLLSAFALQGDLDGMLGTLEDMKESRVRPDALTYSILISGYLQNGDLRFAMEWYYKLIDSGYAPATLVVNNLMAALHGSGQGQQIMLIWREMNNLGVKKNGQSFEIALEACEKFGLHEAKVQIEEELRNFLVDSSKR